MIVMILERARRRIEARTLEMALLSVVGLTVVFLGVSIALVFSGSESELALRLFDTCTTSFSAGFAAIVALLVLMVKAALRTRDEA